MTGMRLGEFLAARAEDLEGHWLLLRITKTGRARVVYVNGRALGIAAELRVDRRERQEVLFAEMGRPARKEFFGGWTESQSSYAQMAHERLLSIAGVPEKPQQTMRKACSTWMLDPARHDLEAESAQLGHGGNLQMLHYVGAMQRLPRLLEPFGQELPAIGSHEWPAPLQEVPQTMPNERRGGIWDELRKLLAQGRRRGANSAG